MFSIIKVKKLAEKSLKNLIPILLYKTVIMFWKKTLSLCWKTTDKLIWPLNRVNNVIFYLMNWTKVKGKLKYTSIWDHVFVSRICIEIALNMWYSRLNSFASKNRRRVRMEGFKPSQFMVLWQTIEHFANQINVRIVPNRTEPKVHTRCMSKNITIEQNESLFSITFSPRLYIFLSIKYSH